MTFLGTFETGVSTATSLAPLHSTILYSIFYVAHTLIFMRRSGETAFFNIFSLVISKTDSSSCFSVRLLTVRGFSSCQIPMTLFYKPQSQCHPGVLSYRLQHYPSPLFPSFVPYGIHFQCNVNSYFFISIINHSRRRITLYFLGTTNF